MTPREAFDAALKSDPALRANMESMPANIGAIAAAFWQSGWVAGNLSALQETVNRMRETWGERTVQ